MKSVGEAIGEVLFKPFDRRVLVQKPKVLLDLAREAGIHIRADCGGTGVCGKCAVKLLAVDGILSPPTLGESTALGPKRIGEGYRLACQVRVIRGRAEVYVPIESLIQRYRSADVGLEKHIPLNPAIALYRITLSGPSLKDAEPDLDRIIAGIERSSPGIDISSTPLDVIRKLPDLAREAGWELDVVLWMDRILDLKPHSSNFKPLGVAVDIGTSRIVLHLVDLETGETLAVESMSNPQAVYGADVASRLTYASKSSENLGVLHEMMIEAVNTLIKKATDRTATQSSWIYEAVVVGNTVMHHIFLGVQPKYIGLAPYTPALRGPLKIHAEKLGLDMNRNGIVYLPPVIAGFVGSDAVSDAVAVGLDECREPCMLIDIGTNTEIVINTGKRMVAGSAPAGPALEGASTSFGMRAVEGAIDQVFIYYDSSLGDYVVRYSVIGGGKPMGICGSGYIDAVANLYRAGLLNSRGKFVGTVRSSRLAEFEGALRFILVKAEDTSIGRDITIDEKDIDSLLLAKAAIASGVKTLLRHVGLKAEDLAKIYVAGSFGSYLNVENAIAIGILPNVPIPRYEFVGNASVVGAKLMLKSVDVRDRALRLAKAVEYVELAAHPDYKKIFVDSLRLP